MIRFGPTASPPQVWAREDTSLQLTWGDLPFGAVTASTDHGECTVDHRGGPGGLVVDGLPADSSISAELTWCGGTQRFETSTVPSPPGELLTRFATISDLHLGARRWGALKTMRDRSDYEVPHPYRCASAAVAEAIEWGAELLIIKGDAAQHECDADFAQVAKLVDEYPDLPMLLIPGNHDVDGESTGTIPLTIGRRRLAYTRKVDRVDLPGVRVLAADTTLPGRGRGTLTRTGAAMLDEAGASDRPVFLAVHHQLQPGRIPRHWPAGISAPESTDFLDALDRLDMPVTVSSGHTHRNRSRMHRGVMITEVASTKDWPGVWAGYAVHEGGIRQVIRRIMQPEAIVWTEYSRGALNGLWSMWSPGPIEQRCISQPWARRTHLV